MEKMITISYYLTETGRKADILQGGPGVDLVVIEIPCTPEALAVAEARPDGNVIIEVGKSKLPSGYVHNYYAVDVPLTGMAALALHQKLIADALNADAEEKAEKALEREAAIAKILGTPVPDLVHDRYNLGDAWGIVRALSDLRDEPCLADTYKHACDLAAARNNQTRQERETLEAKRAAEQEAARQTAMKLKVTAISLWANEFADALDHERYLAGVLPEDEAIEAIKRLAFHALDQVIEYRRINESDLEGGDGDEGCEHDIEVDMIDNPKLTREQFTYVKELKAAMGGDAEYVVRLHHAFCGHCDAVCDRYGLLVRVNWSGLKLAREYEIMGEE